MDLFRAVVSLDAKLMRHITLPRLLQVVDAAQGYAIAAHAGDRDRVKGVYKLTEYLASDRVGLLDPHFELLRDDDEPVLLDRGEVIAAIRTGGKLYDPETGRAIADWERHVVPYYTATDLLKEIVRERD